VWQDSEAKKEVLSKLKKINKEELTPRNQKSLRGFKKLKEYKFNKIRIIVNTGQKGAPDTIVAIVKRLRLDNLMKTFKTNLINNKMMRIKKIRFIDEVRDEYTDSIDVGVEFEDN